MKKNVGSLDGMIRIIVAGLLAIVILSNAVTGLWAVILSMASIDSLSTSSMLIVRGWDGCIQCLICVRRLVGFVHTGNVQRPVLREEAEDSV